VRACGRGSSRTTEPRAAESRRARTLSGREGLPECPDKGFRSHSALIGAHRKRLRRHSCLPDHKASQGCGVARRLFEARQCVALRRASTTRPEPTGACANRRGRTAELPVFGRPEALWSKGQKGPGTGCGFCLPSHSTAVTLETRGVTGSVPEEGQWTAGRLTACAGDTPKATV
jgi:hypothetical protein